MKGKNTNDEKRIPAFSQFFVRMLCAFLLFIFHFGFAGIHFDENAVLDAEEETELSLPDGHEAQNIEPEKAKIYVTEGTTIVNLDENVDVVLIKNLPAEKEIKAEKDLFASSEPKTQKKISTKTEVKTPPSVKKEKETKEKLNYFPIQNLEKIFPKTSSFVNSPDISPRYSKALRSS